jgi:hypothetical protein
MDPTLAKIAWQYGRLRPDNDEVLAQVEDVMGSSGSRNAGVVGESSSNALPSSCASSDSDNVNDSMMMDGMLQVFLLRTSSLSCYFFRILTAVEKTQLCICTCAHLHYLTIISARLCLASLGFLLLKYILVSV